MDSENKKAVRVALAVSCLIVGYLLNRGLVYLANAGGVANTMLWGAIPLSGLISAVLVGGLFIYLVVNLQVMTFLTEVAGELKKVVWPTRKETTLSTIVVIVLVFITAILTWFFDWVWASLIRMMIS